MSLKKLFRLRHRLTFRLTLWYAGIFTVSSCVAFILFYFLITSVIRDQIDQDLSGKAQKFSQLLVSSGMEAVRRVAVIETQAAGEKKIFFRLVSRTGSVFSSSNMSYWMDIDVNRQAIKKLVEGEKIVFATIAIPERKHGVRVLYTLMGTSVILQLGQSMESYTGFIEAFKKIFIITMAFLVILAAVVGWFMAGRALSGLGKVMQTARNISSDALGERVPRTGTGDEIDQLANTFNQMLDRIQKLITGTREMSDNIAHDLKSPVTRIRGIAEVTLATDSSLDEYKNMTAGTIEECDRLLDMINTMLLISKTEAGVEKILYENIDISKVISEACTLFQPLAEDKGIQLDCNFPENAPFRGDIPMIQRMISNLIDNAIKYSETDGAIEINTNIGADNSIIISVKDSGIGIHERDLHQIFNRFYRADPSRAQTGSGLGLSLAEAIVRAHGGNITVESSPGKGSTFTVTLPA